MKKKTRPLLCFSIFCHPAAQTYTLPLQPAPPTRLPHLNPAPHTMATTFLDLPADVWGKVASALPEIKGVAPPDRVSLALAHKDLYDDLFRSGTGAA